MVDDIATDEGSAKGGKSKLLIIIVGALLLVSATIEATLFFIGGSSVDKEETETPTPKAEVQAAVQPPVQYIKLQPEFVVNFQVGPKQKFLQIHIEVMTRNTVVAAALEEHSPKVRNEVLRVISEQEFEQLRTATSRIALKQAITDVVKKVVKEESGHDDIEEILFTNYVIQ